MSHIKRKRKSSVPSCSKMSVSVELEKTVAEQQTTMDDLEILSCHVLTESLLTSGSGFSNYQGIFNLSVVLLVLIHIQMCLENFTKYGLLVDPRQIVSYLLQDRYNCPALYLNVGMILFVFPALYLENLKTKSYSAETLGSVLQYIHLALLIAAPGCVVYCVKSISPGTDLPSRHSKMNDRGLKQIMYPWNLTIQDFCYFIMAPTLCYQLNFPRSKWIRKRFIFWRLFEMVFLAQLVLGLIQQWIAPIIQKSLKPINEIEFSLLMEYILKLAVPNQFVWLILFYWFFHCFLNLIAELLCFGDREFYLDWWNTNNLLNFWSDWNRPLHTWFIRHVYTPLLLHGFEKLQAQTVVFLISAIIYEYLISVPLQMFQFWIFTTVLAQVPLFWLMEKVCGGSYGNVILWGNAVLGTPLVVFLYFHDYYVEQIRSGPSWGLFF
ncbi:diacylglycerol O-acyltransferase 1 isoform X2 [Microcaecilia unicolor]|uniref:O-acyltransferase n=1 Tax=Microcaecilia unicolor TaxID=1415580 RepID=A0A6P7XRM4_9AMPH|nr:diacylglycerol O-acyltransferase 1-like isoform X2 [Microcaecilia unicolor]